MAVRRREFRQAAAMAVSAGLAKVSVARARSGRGHEGGSHQTEDSCVSVIDLDINMDVWTRR
jgi:hypothetical protein